MRRVVGSLLLGAAIAGVALPALARHSDVADENDVSGKLDIHLVTLAHRTLPPVWTVITYQKWRIKEIWDRGYVLVYLDTMGTEGPEYYALVRSDGTEMLARLFRDRAVTDADLGALRAWRPDVKSVAVSIPLQRLILGPTRTSYRWWAMTLLTGPACHRTCIDRAPDSGSVDQPLPGSQPSSTPSP